MRIQDRKIGTSQPVYIVAEMSANHNQDFDRAVLILQAAKDAGADAIKLQTYTADTITIACRRESFAIGGGTIWDGQRLYELYSRASTPWEWHAPLQKVARSIGLDFFS